jgi:hypothetical protein
MALWGTATAAQMARPMAWSLDSLPVDYLYQRWHFAARTPAARWLRSTRKP